MVTACHRGDYLAVKATCASIRYFMPDVPICVIADGDVDVSELLGAYGIDIIRIEDLREHGLCRLLTGSSRTKLAALWYGPYRRFAYLDSDAIVWGDIRTLLDFQNYNWNIISDSEWPSKQSMDFDKYRRLVDHYFFDTKRIAEIDPSYHWQGRPFFCAGVYAAERDAIPLERFLEVLYASEKHPGVFKFMDQGLLNYLVHRGSDNGLVNYKIVPEQFIPEDHGTQSTKQRLGWTRHLPSVEMRTSRPCFVHFCGVKPLLQYRGCFSVPFTHFRLMHQVMFLRKSKAQAWFTILMEEAKVFSARTRRRLLALRPSRFAQQ